MTTILSHTTDTGTKSQIHGVHCDVCGKTYRLPRILPCLHSFCTQCIFNLPTSTAAQRDEVIWENGGPILGDFPPRIHDTNTPCRPASTTRKSVDYYNLVVPVRERTPQSRMRNATSDEHLSGRRIHPSASGLSVSRHALVIEGKNMPRSLSYNAEKFSACENYHDRYRTALGRSTSAIENTAKSSGVYRTSSLKDETSFRGGRKSLSYNSVVSFHMPKTATTYGAPYEGEGATGSISESTRRIICPKCFKEAQISIDLHELPRNLILERLVDKANFQNPDHPSSDLNGTGDSPSHYPKHQRLFHNSGGSDTNDEKDYSDYVNMENSVANDTTLSHSDNNQNNLSALHDSDYLGRNHAKRHRVVKLIEFDVKKDLDEIYEVTHRKTTSPGLICEKSEKTLEELPKRDAGKKEMEDSSIKTKTSKRIVKKLKLPKLFQFGKFLSCGSSNYNDGTPLNDRPIHPKNRGEKVDPGIQEQSDNETGGKEILNDSLPKRLEDPSIHQYYNTKDDISTSNVSLAKIDEFTSGGDTGISRETHALNTSENRDTINGYYRLSCTASTNNNSFGEMMYPSALEEKNGYVPNGDVFRNNFGSSFETDVFRQSPAHGIPSVHEDLRVGDSTGGNLHWETEREQISTHIHPKSWASEPPAPPAPPAARPVTCVNHPNQELSHFCLACEECLCRGCVVTLHPRHDCRPITNQLFKDQMADVDRLIRNAVPKVKEVELRMSDLELQKTKVKDRATEISGVINDFIDLYVDAVEKHRLNLLTQVDALQQAKLTCLEAAELHLQHMHSDVQETCRFVAELLRGATSDTEILSVKRLIVLRLSALMDTPLAERRELGGFLKFCSTERGDIINNFQLFGRVVDHEASAAKSYISGDGLSVVRIGRSSTLRLTVCDEDGVPCNGSDVTVKAWLRPLKEQFNSIPQVTVERLDGGDHGLHFTPTSKGLHLLHVALNGEPIKGSPFKFNVKSRWRQHQGAWQCCTFCSTGGRPDVACGCGGAVGGGYLGCCHDHPAHPGGHHWSCCGKMTVDSECGLVLPSGTSSRAASTIRQFAL